MGTEHPETDPNQDASQADEASDASAASVKRDAAASEPEWKRKQRLAEIFGDVLPATTSDERGPGTDTRRESAGDAWLRSQVPPHHGNV